MASKTMTSGIGKSVEMRNKGDVSRRLIDKGMRSSREVMLRGINEDDRFVLRRRDGSELDPEPEGGDGVTNILFGTGKVEFVPTLAESISISFSLRLNIPPLALLDPEPDTDTGARLVVLLLTPTRGLAVRSLELDDDDADDDLDRFRSLSSSPFRE